MSDAGTALVLLVDDDADIRETLALILSSRGYRVAEAADGQQALAQLESGLGPRLVVLDPMMPALNGPQFLAQLARCPEAARPRVLVISGDRTVDRRVPGADDFLRKPFDMGSFLAKVKALCAE